MIFKTAVRIGLDSCNQNSKNAITNFISVIWVSQGRSITSFRLRVSPKLAIWVRDKSGHTFLSGRKFSAREKMNPWGILPISFLLHGIWSKILHRDTYMNLHSISFSVLYPTTPNIIDINTPF